MARMPLSLDRCQKSFWKFSSGSGKAILKLNWRAHSGFNDKIALCFRKSVTEIHKIFSTNGKAVIFVKSVWHQISETDSRRKQSWKVMEGHFSIKAEKEIWWLTATRRATQEVLSCRNYDWNITKQVSDYLNQVPSATFNWKTAGTFHPLR